ncbi:MAG: hypothetical protein OXC01_21895 [Immundisolibacterales bacterium]|nr:hypothetical protein [Immundisolibacterales bacterium]
MTNSQKLAVRLSEIRQRLNEIAGLDDDGMTDEVRAEADRLTAEYHNKETQHRAAVVAEADEARAAAGEFNNDDGAGEGAEVRALRGRVRIGEYVSAAVEQRSAEGAEAEYNAALKIRGNAFPLSLIAPAPVEARATTDTDSQTNQSGRWLDRLFAGTAAERIGVTMESVAPGVASFPVTSTGASAAQRGRSEAAADSAWTVGVTELKPTRNAVRVVFNEEDAHRLPSLEASLRRDLGMALAEGVDRAIFLGDAGASETTANILGLNTAAGVVDVEVSQADKILGPGTLAAFTGLIDGIHAMGFGDLMICTSVGAWRLWESTIINAAADNMTLAAFLRKAGVTWSARGEIETATDDGDWGAFIGRSRGIDGAGVAALWEAGMLLRDPYSASAKGEINLTLSYFWNFGLPRASNFARLSFGA